MLQQPKLAVPALINVIPKIAASTSRKYQKFATQKKPDNYSPFKHPRPEKPVKFFVCCKKRIDSDDSSNNAQRKFHFHESSQKHNCCDTCSEAHDGKVYDAVELAQEGARAKVVNNYELY